MVTPSQSLEDLLSSLEKKCEAATPGPWQAERYDADNGYIHYSVNDERMAQVAFCHQDMHPKTFRKDAEFIASCNPSTVKKLIAALRVADNALARFDVVLRRDVSGVVYASAPDTTEARSRIREILNVKND